MASTTNGGKSGRDFKVTFGLSEPGISDLRAFDVLIVPSAEKVKDFGFRTRVDIHVRLDGDLESLTVSGYLGFVTSTSDEFSDVRKIEENLSATSELTIAADESQHFFTMLPTLDDYRRLVRIIGGELVAKLLLAINDVVALGELQPRSNIPKIASTTQVFQKSFIRTSESFFAFKNAGPILRGVDSEQFGRMSKDIEIRFQLSGIINKHQLQFRFDHDGDLPKRIAVIIGKNGVGKSQALGQIVRAALAGDDGSLREASTRERVLMNRLLAFAPTNESTSVFPSDRRKNAKVWYKRFALNRAGRVRRGGGAADIVLQVARSNGYIGNSSRWKIFLTAIQAISGWEQIALLKADKAEAPVPVSALRSVVDDDSSTPSGGANDEAMLDLFASIDANRDPVRQVDANAYPLSSGEISFLRFAAQASLFVENGSLLLLDEPETHLHPNFISHFVALLNNLLAQTGSAAVIATHSAYLVREVFREQVTVLRTTNDGYVLSDPLRLQTFGADVGSISYFVFGEDEPSMLASEVEERLLARYQNWDQLFADYKDQLSPEMLGSLRLALESGRRDE